MATLAARPAYLSYADDQPFFLRCSIVFACVIPVAFVQLILRGITDPRTEPWWVHLHAFAMFGWVALFVAQNLLATRDLRLHRRLGKLSVALAFAILALGWFTVIQTFRLHRTIPGYSDAWFIMQTGVEAPAFLALVLAGVAWRGDPQVHRRLMFGALIIVAINPVVSRVLPDGLAADPASGWVMVPVELALLGGLLRHDRKVLGAAHPASWWVGGIVVACQVLMIAGSYSPSIAGLAPALARI